MGVLHMLALNKNCKVKVHIYTHFIRIQLSMFLKLICMSNKNRFLCNIEVLSISSQTSNKTNTAFLSLSNMFQDQEENSS